MKRRLPRLTGHIVSDATVSQSAEILRLIPLAAFGLMT